MGGKKTSGLSLFGGNVKAGTGMDHEKECSITKAHGDNEGEVILLANDFWACQPEQEKECYSMSLSELLTSTLFPLMELCDTLENIEFTTEGEGERNKNVRPKVLAALIRDMDHHFEIVADFLNKAFGDIEIKYRIRKFTYSTPDLPAVLAFKPAPGLIQKIASLEKIVK